MVSAHDSIATSVAPLLLIVAAVILSVMALLFWIAFRRRRQGPAETPGGTQG
jgi:membrane protein implicated in regulation of membrane protease activity